VSVEAIDLEAEAVMTALQYGKVPKCPPLYALACGRLGQWVRDPVAAGYTTRALAKAPKIYSQSGHLKNSIKCYSRGKRQQDSPYALQSHTPSGYPDSWIVVQIRPDGENRIFPIEAFMTMDPKFLKP
jgi:hypothetical protein